MVLTLIPRVFGALNESYGEALQVGDRVYTDKDEKMEKIVTITVKTGFFAKVGAFFRSLFGIRLKTVLKS